MAIHWLFGGYLGKVSFSSFYFPNIRGSKARMFAVRSLRSEVRKEEQWVNFSTFLFMGLFLMCMYSLF